MQARRGEPLPLSLHALPACLPACSALVSPQLVTIRGRGAGCHRVLQENGEMAAHDTGAWGCTVAAPQWTKQPSSGHEMPVWGVVVGWGVGGVISSGAQWDGRQARPGRNGACTGPRAARCAEQESGEGGNTGGARRDMRVACCLPVQRVHKRDTSDKRRRGHAGMRGRAQIKFEVLRSRLAAGRALLLRCTWRLQLCGCSSAGAMPSSALVRQPYLRPQHLLHLLVRHKGDGDGRHDLWRMGRAAWRSCGGWRRRRRLAPHQ